MTEEQAATQGAQTGNPAWSYENYLVPTLFAPWASDLVETAAPTPGERCLDIACGTGIVARLAAPRVAPGGGVTGLDFNANMLAVARAVAEQEGLAIDWHEGNASALPFPDGHFNAVLCQQGLQFFPDRTAALAEMHRVLTPGGRAIISVWQPLEMHPFFQTLFGAIERHLGITGVAAPFSLGDEAKLRGIFAEAGFQTVEVTSASKTSRYPDPGKFLAQTIQAAAAAIPAMQNLDAQSRQDVTSAVREELESPLNKATDGDHVVLEWHAFVTRAGK